MSTAGDADGFVVNLQADGTRELALDALSRGYQRAWAVGLLLLLLLAELGARWDKAPKHRHHGAEDDLELSTTARCLREEAVRLLWLRLAKLSALSAYWIHAVQTWWLFNPLIIKLSSLIQTLLIFGWRRHSGEVNIGSSDVGECQHGAKGMTWIKTRI